MITYTETVFNMEARKVEPVARWAVEITAADLLTVTRNGEQKTVKIVPDSGFVYSLKKTYIRAAAFLCRFSIRHAFAIGQNERCFKPTANGPGNVLQIRRSKPLPLHFL